jgi:hypothetical protein
MECRRGSHVAIVSRIVAGLIEAKLQTNDVLRVAIVQGPLPRRVNDIVGWCHDLSDVSND